MPARVGSAGVVDTPVAGLVDPVPGELVLGFDPEPVPLWLLEEFPPGVLFAPEPLPEPTPEPVPEPEPPLVVAPPPGLVPDPV